MCRQTSIDSRLPTPKTLPIKDLIMPLTSKLRSVSVESVKALEDSGFPTHERCSVSPPWFHGRKIEITELVQRLDRDVVEEFQHFMIQTSHGTPDFTMLINSVWADAVLSLIDRCFITSNILFHIENAQSVEQNNETIPSITSGNWPSIQSALSDLLRSSRSFKEFLHIFLLALDVGTSEGNH